MQAYALQDYMDGGQKPEDIGLFRGLKQAESIPQWMLVEPDPKKARTSDFTPPYEGVTAADIEMMEKLPNADDA